MVCLQYQLEADSFIHLSSARDSPRNLYEVTISSAFLCSFNRAISLLACLGGIATRFPRVFLLFPSWILCLKSICSTLLEINIIMLCLYFHLIITLFYAPFYAVRLRTQLKHCIQWLPRQREGARGECHLPASEALTVFVRAIRTKINASKAFQVRLTNWKAAFLFNTHTHIQIYPIGSGKNQRRPNNWPLGNEPINKLGTGTTQGTKHASASKIYLLIACQASARRPFQRGVGGGGAVLKY